MKIHILGCGDSRGTPVMGAGFVACDPNNPKNHRTRASLALDSGSETWLIDMSPDLRQQYFRAGLSRIDGVLCTHAHFDHVAGIDELKAIAQAQEQVLPLYADAATLDLLHKRYRYIFGGAVQDADVYRPFMESRIIDGPFTIAGAPVIPFVQDHRVSESLGFRFDNWAYSTDVWQLDEQAFSCLENLDLWIVDCLDRVPRFTHTHLERTLQWIERLAPKHAVLTHMSAYLDYETLRAELPKNVRPAYDGLCIEVGRTGSVIFL